MAEARYAAILPGANFSPSFYELWLTPAQLFIARYPEIAKKLLTLTPLG
jgi:hypothetical protein